MAKKKKICIDKDEMISEHERIVRVLREKDKKDIQAELEEQSKELKDYKEASDHFVEVSLDGKQQIVEGKEPLKKDPDLKAKWKSIKKSLNNALSIMDLGEEMSEPSQEEQPQPQQDQSPPDDVPSEQQQQEAQEQAPEEQPQDAMQQEQQPEQSPEELEQFIEQALRDEGYSDSEIAYIIKGHHIHEEDMPDPKEQLEVQHSERIMDHDADHHKRLLDHEHDHKKRMSDLEYEFARQQKQLELDHLKQQLEHKLNVVKETANKKISSMKSGDSNE